LKRVALIIPVVMLQACSDPAFYFRGYNSDSPCNAIIDTELALGGEFVDAYESRDAEATGYVTTLAGELFGEPVRIEIRCERGNRAASIHYLADEQEPQKTGALYAKFSSELEAQFGFSVEQFSEIHRARYFLCDHPAPIFIEEWALVDDVEDEVAVENREHELYLAIVPEAAICLENTG
jgi:hypothetical protein